MTTDDVIGEFMRRAPYIDGVAETHYLDANAMAAEIVRLREVAAANYRNMERLGVEVERLRESVRELETFIDNLVREANA